MRLWEVGNCPSFHRIRSVGGRLRIWKRPSDHHRQVIIWDDAKQKVAVQIPVLTTVRGVKLTRTHIVVALHNSTRVYKFQTQPELWAAFETADNPLGLCCLTSKTVTFPGRTPGQVQLVDLATGSVSIIPAHGSSLRALEISRDGKILATASDKVGFLDCYLLNCFQQSISRAL